DLQNALSGSSPSSILPKLALRMPIFDRQLKLHEDRCSKLKKDAYRARALRKGFRLLCLKSLRQRVGVNHSQYTQRTRQKDAVLEGKAKQAAFVRRCHSRSRRSHSDTLQGNHL